jgi:hypothetical protein
MGSMESPESLFQIKELFELATTSNIYEQIQFSL